MDSMQSRKSRYENIASSTKDIEFIGWVGEFRNNQSKMMVKHSCGHIWTPSAQSIVYGRGCPKCSGRLLPSPDEYIRRINNETEHTFVSWAGDDRGSRCRVFVMCNKGHVFESAIYNILGGSIHCAECNGKKRRSSEYREKQISEIDGVSFVSWDGVYSSLKSRATVLHSCGLKWTSTVGDLISGRGCPSCAKYGFDPSKPAFMYALLSSCGSYMKVGIANNIKRRITELKRETPFDFHVSAYVVFDVGRDARLEEKRMHASLKSAGMSGFNGCSEWFNYDSIAMSKIKEMAAADKRVAQYLKN